MDFAYFIPISFFVCTLLAIKFIVDAYVRRRIMEAGPNEELVKALLQADEQNRRWAALKWGLVLTLVGLAFGVIGALHLDSNNPGSWGLLVRTAGVGMLAYHGIANRAR